MDELFDTLARESAGTVSRRQVFGRFGLGLAAALCASLGLRASNAECAKCCEALCRSERAPGGTTPGECMRDCLAGGSQYVAACVPVCSGH
jgi:hypothetical protein